MKLLAFESSATAASVALCEDEALLAQSFQHTGLTHSQTLLPMAKTLLASCGQDLAGVDLLAVAAGPGSFTGLRIGVATVKGLAWARQLPCVACSTLASMAWNAVGLTGQLCAVMDARRDEVYCAGFLSDGETITRLTPDCPLPLQALASQLQNASTPLWLIGDGAGIAFDYLNPLGIPAKLAPPNLRLQSAWGVAREALRLYHRGDVTTGDALRPNYLRLSQAERERLAGTLSSPTGESS